MTNKCYIITAFQNHIQSIREEEEQPEELDDEIQQPPTVWGNPFANKRPAGSGYRNQQQDS